ncbi:site-specific DNA-methyltransferase [Candidatus Saccharibacteria bacterium]|nr:MAG: site-specific DNA-methyltransferase [Candidatus Saccharibacteria bacterium]
MNLDYAGKKSEKEILANAKSLKRSVKNTDNSLLLKGDNFTALSSLLPNYTGKIDLIYIDPPFNTNQTFTVEDERVSTISRKKNAIVAYSDQMTPSEYIEFMRERLILLRELLSDNGSIYLHIDTKMGHYVKIIMDEVFGIDNFKNDITRIKSNPKNFMRKAYGNQKDVIYFYAKNKDKNIFNNVTIKLDENDKAKMFKKVDENGRRYNTVPVHAPGETNGKTGSEWRGMFPPSGRHWRTDPRELDKLDNLGLIEWSKNGVPRIKKFADEHKGKKMQDIWNYIDPAYPLYPTEKNLKMLEMIIEQSSHDDSIILDCFAGSGSTLLAAQNLGRRWIGIDQSDVSHKVIKKRFDKIAHEYLEL